MDQYFIILHMPNGPVPIMDEHDELAVYPSVQKARDAMEGHPAAEHFGFEVFCVGCGE